MSKVVVIKNPGLENPGRLAYAAMLKAGLAEFFGTENPIPSLAQMFPSGAVGMKVNCLTRKFNSTPVALTGAFGDLLLEAGVAENNIVVWERTNRELKDAGFELNASSFGRRCLGTDTNGLGYSSSFFNSGDVNSLISSILTDLLKHNVNMPILKDHSLAGLSGCFKNMYGAIHNPNKYHDNNCDPYAAHVSNLAPIRDKTRLIIMDAVRIQYNNGPGYDSRYLANYGGLIIARDPVAADTIALEIMENLRAKNKLTDLKDAGRQAKHIKTGESLGLGVATRDKIDLRVIVMDNNGRISNGELT
jgi:uncharacterized protein (DUF362 family)